MKTQTHNRKNERGPVLRSRKGEEGSALVYILIAIALLAALTVSFMEPSSQQTSSQSTFRTVTGVKTQIDSIRSSLQECVLRYPNGDSNIPNGGGQDEEGARREFPIRPNSPYYDAAPASTLAATAGRLVRDIRCPGNVNGPETKDHEKIFSGASGKFLPPAPALFGEWEYYNATDGVFFWIETDNTDAFLQTSMAKLDEQYGECEADVIDASGGDQDLNSVAGTADNVVCPSGSTCFRVWMIQDGTAVFNGDSDGDEAGC